MHLITLLLFALKSRHPSAKNNQNEKRSTTFPFTLLNDQTLLVNIDQKPIFFLEN